MVGSVIDGAAQETYNAGDKKAPDYKPRYTMAQLLDPKFRLPAPGAAPGVTMMPGNGLAALAKLPGVKVLKQKKG